MGVLFSSMKSDAHGKGVVRDKLKDKGRRLFDALKRHVESNAFAILDSERTVSAIERDVSGGSGGRSFLDDIAGAISDFVSWLTDADDPIEQNRILLIGLSEAILRERLGGDYRPTSYKNPLAAIMDRHFNLEFSGDDTRYTVRVELRRSGGDVSV